jgi:ATP synthase protein I
VAAKSAALGALLCWLGSAYFAWQAFRQGGAQASQRVLGSMYKGMIGKFVIIVTGFIIIFRALKPVMMEALLAGFVTVQLMAWIYPLLMMRRKKQA